MQGTEEEGRQEHDDHEDQLEDAVQAQRRADPVGHAAAHDGADRHAAEEARENGRDGLGRVAEDEDELPRPDDLVDQAGRAGQDEDREDQAPAGVGATPPLRRADRGPVGWLHGLKYSKRRDFLLGRLPSAAMDAAAPRFGGLTRGISRNVVALGLVSLLTDVSSEMLVYLIPLFLANVLAASPSIIGLIEGIAESVASLLRLVSGAISDWIGRRKLLVGIGYGSSVAGKALLLVATSWPMVLLARLGDRIGKGIRTSPRDALITDSTPADSRGRAFGFHRAMDTTGAVIGVAAAAIVVAAVQGDASKLSEGTFHDLVLLALVPGVLAVVTIVIGVHDVRIGSRAAEGRRGLPGHRRPPVAAGSNGCVTPRRACRPRTGCSCSPRSCSRSATRATPSWRFGRSNWACPSAISCS